MNVLPLVSAFILLFAIGSYAFLHNAKAAFQEKFHYTQALAVERTFANQMQSEKYRLKKGDNQNPQQTKSTNKKETEFISPRDKLRSDNSRNLNIRALAADQGNPRLEEITLTLLKNIYQSTSIYTPNMEREVLNVIVATLKMHPKVKSFAELLTKLPDEQIPLFYKLIKGTQQYDLYTNLGYPALGDFLTIDPAFEKKKPIYFPDASRPVLSALFGKKLSEQIIAEERRKWDAKHEHDNLSQKELEAFLQKNTKNPSDYAPWVGFGDPGEKKSQEIVQSKNSTLQIRINL